MEACQVASVGLADELGLPTILPGVSSLSARHCNAIATEYVFGGVSLFCVETFPEGPSLSLTCGWECQLWKCVKARVGKQKFDNSTPKEQAAAAE